MFEVIKTDSLKLRIPRHKVTYVDSTFAKKYQKLYTDTGEIENHINLDKNKVNITNGITTRIGVFKALQGGFTEEQIYIQCNAKQLKEKYFQGIEINTVRDLYKYIIDLKIIHVNYEDFLNGYVSDIDICYDVKVSPKAMIEANQEIFRNIKPECYKYVGKPFRQKENVGLQFNTREKATPAKPYLKIYHKTLELKSKSLEFAESYLQNIDYNDIGRLEYTIKNSKHKKHLDLHITSLRDLINLDQTKFESIIFSGILNYIDKKTMSREFQDLSPTNKMLFHFINRTIHLGDDKEIIHNVLNNFEKPQERSRMKKLLKSLLEQVNDKMQLVKNAETHNFLRALKIDF